MASSNKEPFKQKVKNKSAIRGPLNVVVEKVGATRATVRGDVSAESLKELLMSSLSLLPKTVADQHGSEVSENSAESETNHQAERPGKDSGTNSVKLNRKTDEFVGDAKTIKSTERIERSENLEETQKSSASKVEKLRDLGTEKDSSMKPEARTNAKNLMRKPEARRGGKNSPEKREIRSKNNSGNRRNRRSKFGRVVEGEGEEEEEEDSEEQDSSLFSSSSTIFCSSNAEPTFSSDCRWLQINFGKSLIQGLKEIVKKKPQDPVNYLAFYLRNWRHKEEVRRRKEDMEKDLQTQRLVLKNKPRISEELEETFEPESTYDADREEEGGGRRDFNFRDYYRH